MAKKAAALTSMPFFALRDALPQIAAGSATNADAAVAIIFRIWQNEPQVLLIRRAERLGDPWSSHLAFPGGRTETLDANLAATAQRETLEEVGLDLSTCADLLGAAAIRETRAGRQAGARMHVAAFVYFCHSPQALSIDPEEVAEAFWLDVLPLLDGSQDTQIELEHAGNKLRFPGYQVGSRVLWGLSYMLLQPLLPSLRREWLGQL